MRMRKRDMLMKLLDVNFGYLGKERVERVVEDIMRAGIVAEEKEYEWEFLFNAVDGSARYSCPVCKSLAYEKTRYCCYCGSKLAVLK